jgi:hypothetical protein
MNELAAAHDPYPHRLLDYPNAGHAVNALVPYYPGLVWAAPELDGSTILADPLALADQWPKVLAFLEN